MFAIYSVILLPIYLNWDVVNVTKNVDGQYVAIINQMPTVGIINTLALVFANLAPVFVFQYRFKRKKVDTFYQLPLKKNELRNTKIILALLCQIVIITFFYWLCVVILRIRQSIDISVVQGEYSGIDLSNLETYNYIYFLPYYFVLIFFTSCIYFICCFFASLANHTQTSLVYVVLYNAISELFVACLAMFVMKFLGYNYNAVKSLLSCSPSSLGVGNSIYYLFMPLLDASYSKALADILGDINYLARIIATLTEVGIAGCGAAAYCLIVKDPSGEKAGNINGRYRWTWVLPHILGFALTILFGSSLSLTNYIWVLLLIIPFCFIIYYIVLCLIRRTFRLSKADFIILGTFFAVTFILASANYPY